MRRMVAIADDLSGAAETAAALVALGVGPSVERSRPLVEIFLVPADASEFDVDLAAHELCVFDSDSRTAGTEGSQGRLGRLLQIAASASTQQHVVFLKVDSLLRGHLASDLAVLIDRGPVVLAPALPQLGRTTSSGVVHVNGSALHTTDLWSGEGREAPRSIESAIAPLSAGTVGINLVRGNPDELQREIAALASRGAVAICDAETPDDLDKIALATVSLDLAQPAGSSAFGCAVRKALHTVGAPAPPVPAPRLEGGVDGYIRGRDSVRFQRPTGPTLVVVGTASAQSRAQLTALRDWGVPQITVPADELLAGSADSAAVATALLAGPVAVTIDSTRVEGAAPAAVASAFAAFVTPVARGIPLVLTGGATARSVLDSLGVRRLAPIAEIEHGAVLSRTDLGSLVVTRPGTFGAVASLMLILDHIGKMDDTQQPPQRKVSP